LRFFGEWFLKGARELARRSVAPVAGPRQGG